MLHFVANVRSSQKEFGNSLRKWGVPYVFGKKIKFMRWYGIWENPIEIREIFEIIGKHLIKAQELLGISKIIR
jgi:hypothetical protein